MHLDTHLKMIQLVLAFFGVCLGYFVDFIPFDMGSIFYINCLVSVSYLAFVFFRNPKKFISDYRSVLIVVIMILCGIFINRKYSDLYSFVLLAEMTIYLFASLCYTGKENLELIKRFMNGLFRVLTVILFTLTLFTFVNGILGTHMVRILPGFMNVYSPEQYEKWNYELHQMVTGGLYHNGNQLGLNAYISGMLSLYFLNVKKKSPFDVCNLVLQLCGIAVSGCRSMLIATVLTFAVVVYTVYPKNGKKVMSAVLIVSVLILAIMTKNKLKYYFLRDGLKELIDKLTGYRSIIWADCLRLFARKPLFGVGINNIRTAAADIIGTSCLMVTRNYNNAHNIVINILTMTGLTGAASFLLLGRDMLHGMKRTNRYLIILCAGLLLGDCFDIFVLFTDKVSSLLVPMIAGIGIQYMLREQKPVYFFSNALEENVYREIYTKQSKPGQQSQKFNRLIAEGFKLSGRKTECCTAVPVSAALADYKIKKIRDNDIYHYSLSINIPGIKNIWNMAAAFLRVLFSEKGIIVVDTLSVDNAVGALAASKLRGVPSAGIVTDLPEHISSDRTFIKSVYRIINMCSSYIFLTKYMDEKLNSKHKPWIVMEGLCDASVVPAAVHKRNKAIIFAGEIDEENGVLNLADAFNSWGDHGYDLYYYGIGNTADLLKEKTADNRHIHVMGLIYNSELLKIMADASLLMNPRPIHQDFVKYSFPSKVMEYMNTGTYHASSRLACIPDEYFEYIGDLGDGSAEDILKFFREFEMMSEEEAEEKGMQAQKFVLENKNNKIQAERIAALLDGFYE